MNERMKQIAEQCGLYGVKDYDNTISEDVSKVRLDKFAELIVRECVNREELLGAIARGWCSEKNSHKTMDSDLALAIFDEVEQQIKQQFGVEE